MSSTRRLFLAGWLGLFCAATSLPATTSYLLIQGPFGAGNTEQTYKWQVNYDGAAITNGLQLIFAVLGTPTLNGTYADDFSGVYDYFTSSNAGNAAGYIDFTAGLNTALSNASLFTESFTLNSKKVAQGTGYDPSWNYFVKGGSGSGHGGAYTDPDWEYSDDGLNTRLVGNTTYDAWVFGGFGTEITNGTTVNAPSALSFAGATIINFSAVPEPGRAALLLAGLVTLTLHRRRGVVIA
jgi:hypothetical protein